VPGRRRRTYSAGEAARRRHGWLELVQTSGPFLTLPVVDRAWPDGLPEVAAGPRAASRAAVAEAIRTNGATRHQAVRTVLCEALDWAEHLRLDTDLPASLAEPVPEHALTVAPDLGFRAEPDDEDADSGLWRLLGLVTAWGTHPLARTTENGWTASAVERLAVLLRARDVPVGLVTDGRWWAVVWAPKGGTTGAAVWDASLWGEEPESFRAFVALLTRSRFLAVAAAETLPALLVESLGAQEEVTETLGRQVRDAVELLLETLDRLDAETGVLDGVTDDDLYDGVVTVLMRLVFLLFAEERRLLPSDDATYVAAYSISRLVEQLESAEALAGPQSLEHRTGAWHRLLAVSRALHRGVAHEDLRLPAYGGTLFDPDRFPWLEGRRDPGDVQARPPAVDDRTVLRLLRAVQYVEVGGERRRLTFRALDVEQIGYVYEGLLELEVRTAPEVILGLVRPPPWPKGKAPAEITLTEAVDRLSQPSGPTMAEWVAARTGWSATRLAKVFQTPLQVERRAALVRAVGDVELATSIEPYAGVLRWDELGRPSVILPGRRYIAPSTRRASTGTHYTPRSPRTSPGTHWRPWSSGPGRSKPPTAAPGGSDPRASCWTCGSLTSPWAPGRSWSLRAATSPTASSRPGKSKAARRRCSPPGTAPSSGSQPTLRSSRSRWRPAGSSPNTACTAWTSTRWRWRWRSCRCGWSPWTGNGPSGSSTTGSSPATACSGSPPYVS